MLYTFVIYYIIVSLATGTPSTLLWCYPRTVFTHNGSCFTVNGLCVVIGLEKFFSKLDDEHKTMFKEILKNNKEALKLTFVFIDIPSSFKKYEYEEWYKNNFDMDDGIWIGSGVTQQYVIKLSTQPAKISNIDGEHAVVVKNGIPRVIKLINEIK